MRPCDSLYGLVEPLLAVGCQRGSLDLAPEEEVDLPLQRGGAGKEPRRQPQQLPAPPLTGGRLGARQLLDDLTVGLIAKRLLHRGIQEGRREEGGGGRRGREEGERREQKKGEGEERR